MASRGLRLTAAQGRGGLFSPALLPRIPPMSALPATSPQTPPSRELLSAAKRSGLFVADTRPAPLRREELRALSTKPPIPEPVKGPSLIAEHLSPADFHVAVTELPIAALIVDNTGVVVDMNDQFSSRIGYSKADLIGKPVRDIVPPSVRSRHDSLLQGYFEDPTVRSMGSRSSRVEIQIADGTLVPAEIALYPCPDRDCAAALISLLSDGKRDPFKRNLWLAIAMLAAGAVIEFLKSQVMDLDGIPSGSLLVGAGATLLAQQGAPALRDRRDGGAS